MAQVFPFRAFRYNPEVAPFQKVLTQPYDKISPEMQQKYYDAHPQNLIAVEKGKEFPGDASGNNVYSRAAAAFKDWEAKHAIVQDAAPSFYAYTQEFIVPGTSRAPYSPRLYRRRQTRRIFRWRHLPPRTHALRPQSRSPRTSSQHAHPHRPALFALLRSAEACRCNHLRSRKVRAACHRSSRRVRRHAPPLGRFRSAKGFRDPICNGRSEARHRRRPPSLRNRAQLSQRAPRASRLHPIPTLPTNRAMMTFINTRSEGLVILPTHRVVANVHDFSWASVRRYLEPWFSTEVFAFADDAQKETVCAKFLSRLKAAAAQRAIGVYPARRRWPARLLFASPAPGRRPCAASSQRFAAPA